MDSLSFLSCPFLFLSLWMVVLQISPAYSLTCSTQKFNKNVYDNCSDLPTLNAYLHYTFNFSNSSLSIAFKAPPAKPDGWVGWAIGTAMPGAQALVAMKESGVVVVKKYNIVSYTTINETSELAFDVWDVAAESDSSGSFVIFASLKVPKSGENKLQHIWQVGPSVTKGFPAKHDFSKENLNAMGMLSLLDSQTITKTAAGSVPTITINGTATNSTETGTPTMTFNGTATRTETATMTVYSIAPNSKETGTPTITRTATNSLGSTALIYGTAYKNLTANKTVTANATVSPIAPKSRENGTPNMTVNGNATNSTNSSGDGTTIIVPPSIAPSPHEPPSKRSRKLVIILASSLSTAMFAAFFVWICVRYTRKQRSIEKERKASNADYVEWENSLLQATNLPKRFTYAELKSATDNFHKKLGGGGFGSVFEGSFRDGLRIAVKCLDRFGQGKKEFVAEVETIGNIHHVSLVRLVGFCVEYSHKLLVYEYMSNGSLDKWIFNKDSQGTTLEWKIRKKIILNIAKGLAYLHEDCKMRIAHLDIKPQNILLDDKFEAKLSDFGLARLIDRNQSHVMTQMRGTRGYMAPEWLSGKITEKVDVYSFGVVILEITCGRKNLDLSQPKEDDHLLLLLVKKKAEENQLTDLFDKCSGMQQQCIEEAVEMIRIAIWCLHIEPAKRPSMSMVVKVLEGVKRLEPVCGYEFLTSSVIEAPAEVVMITSEPQPASVLSGPR